jgi:predicted pyridoxine 5'-phosphate oxidase superfamily flavin-nucleotide-binding protein
MENTTWMQPRTFERAMPGSALPRVGHEALGCTTLHLLMANRFRATVQTPTVCAAQKHYYGRAAQSAVSPERDPLTDEERLFIEARDSFYMGTLTETGWPYVQHRGGPPGFLRVLNSTALAFADYGGNRQLLSTGNLAANDRVALFLMDYINQERLKILGHARVLDAREHRELAAKVHAPGTGAGEVERIFVIEVLSFDWNCPKFITPRYSAREIEQLVAPLKARIAQLEAEAARSR